MEVGGPPSASLPGCNIFGKDDDGVIMMSWQTERNGGVRWWERLTFWVRILIILLNEMIANNRSQVVISYQFLSQVLCVYGKE